jgi:hypothetical protein
MARPRNPTADHDARRRGGVRIRPPLLEVKPTPTSCGGIAISPEPMGQIGAEYLQRWGTFVLDPFNERVWVKKVHAAW